MKDKKLKETVIKLITLAAMTCFITQFESCVSDKDEDVNRTHPVVVSKDIPPYYYNLFKPEIRAKLKTIVSYEKKSKDTVANFLYDGKYNIQLYKLSGSYEPLLRSSVKESYINNEIEVGVTFYDNERSWINILDRMVISKRDIPATIFISLYGDNTKIVAKNDSIADYYLRCKNLSIAYHLDGPQEVFATANKSESAVPLEILLLKKNKVLYLLFITPEKGIDMPGAISNNIIVN